MEVVHKTALEWITALRCRLPVVNADDPRGRRVGFQGADGSLHFIGLTDLKGSMSALPPQDRLLLQSPEGRAMLMSGGG